MGERLTGLADQLRGWGVPVYEVDGWASRGAATMSPGGVLIHHDALSASTTAEAALALMVHGRSDLSGPLCQIWLDDDNDHTAETGDPVACVVAAGRANHAGDGNWYGLRGNSALIGIEARNNGRGEIWSPAMILTYMRVAAALCSSMGRHAGWVAGHREYALPKGRKIDPTGIDMNAFRSGVQQLLDADRPPAPVAQPATPVVTPPPVAVAVAEELRRALFYVKQTVLGPNQRNEPDAVKFAQAALTRLAGRPVAAQDGDGVYGPATTAAVRDFRRLLRIEERGFGGPLPLEYVGRNTWDAFYPV